MRLGVATVAWAAVAEVVAVCGDSVCGGAWRQLRARRGGGVKRGPRTCQRLASRHGGARRIMNDRASTVDDLHAIDGGYAPTVLTRRASDGSDLEVVALRVLRREVELDQRHPQMILELLKTLNRAVLLPPALRVEGLEELRVDLVQC